jgi:transposase-like protein
MQRMLAADPTEHLSYEHGQEPLPVQTNCRNAVSRKTLRSEDGLPKIAVPWDREGSFEPRLIAKGPNLALPLSCVGLGRFRLFDRPIRMLRQ